MHKWKWKWSRLFVTPWTIYSPWNSPGQNTGVGSHSLFSRGSSQPKDRTQVSHIAGRCFYHLSHQGSPHMWHHLHVLQTLAHRFSSAQILPYHSTPYHPLSYIPVTLPFSASCHFLQGKYVHRQPPPCIKYVLVSGMFHTVAHIGLLAVYCLGPLWNHRHLQRGDCARFSIESSRA